MILLIVSRICRLCALSFTLTVGLGICAISFAQSPVAYKTAVTYYDFHEDGSNPEFENAPKGGNQYWWTFGTRGRGLVLSSLDNNQKPVWNPAIPVDSNYLVAHVAKWFVSWSAGDLDTIVREAGIIVRLQDSVMHCDTFPPEYEMDPQCYEIYNYDTTHITAGTVISDTLFKNVTINDSLIFYWAPETVSTVVTNYYRLKSPNNLLSSDDFFPVDGKGFEAAGTARVITGHNFSYTMEMHNQFTYQAGQKLYISGDDDIWVFINNTLRIDLGGLHPSLFDTLNLDNCGLTAGQSYNLDLFFAERHSTGSNLMIKSNFVFNQRANFTTIPDYGTSTTIVRKSSSCVPGASMQVTLGRGVALNVPYTTSLIVYSVVDACGRTLIDKKVMYPGASQKGIFLQNNRFTGIVFVRAECFDGQHRNVGVVAGHYMVAQ